MKQSEAVFEAIKSVVRFEEGQNVAEVITSEQRKEVHDRLVKGFLAGEVDMTDRARAKYDTEAKLGGYVSGLISNWIRKDKRLNGGDTYQPKNPGSRAGQGDAQVKELRKLLKIHADDAEKAGEIQGYIDARLSELKSERAKAVEIDESLIPAALRDMVNG